MEFLLGQQRPALLQRCNKAKCNYLLGILREFLILLRIILFLICRLKKIAIYTYYTRVLYISYCPLRNENTYSFIHLQINPPWTLAAQSRKTTSLFMTVDRCCSNWPSSCTFPWLRDLNGIDLWSTQATWLSIEWMIYIGIFFLLSIRLLYL